MEISLPAEDISTSFTSIIGINNNRLCSLPDSIADWIDIYAADTNWRATQDCP